MPCEVCSVAVATNFQCLWATKARQSDHLRVLHGFHQQLLSLQALRGETMVDALPRACRYIFGVWFLVIFLRSFGFHAALTGKIDGSNMNSSFGFVFQFFHYHKAPGLSQLDRCQALFINTLHQL